jgi:CcmD family protein
MQKDSDIPATNESIADRKSEFVAVSGGQETTSAEGLLLTAYILMWMFVFGFVFLSVKRQAKIDRRLDELETELKRLDSQQG